MPHNAQNWDKQCPKWQCINNDKPIPLQDPALSGASRGQTCRQGPLVMSASKDCWFQNPWYGVLQLI